MSLEKRTTKKHLFDISLNYSKNYLDLGMLDLGKEGEEAIMTTTNIMPVMTDIHMHIIPSVDDGAWDLDMSMRMIYMAYEQGVRKMIATPHSSAFEENQKLVQIGYQQLKEKLARFYPDMELALGCEVFCRQNIMKDILTNLKKGVFPSMNGTKYVLTEFNTLMDVEEVKFCVTQLLEAGWIPLIAHVERYPRLFLEVKVLEELKQMGCLLQINVFSVFEEDEWGIRQRSVSLVEKKMVDFLGSDAHRTFHRPPSVERGLKYLYETYEKEYVDAIAFGNAEKLLLD